MSRSFLFARPTQRGGECFPPNVMVAEAERKGMAEGTVLIPSDKGLNVGCYSNFFLNRAIHFKALFCQPFPLQNYELSPISLAISFSQISLAKPMSLLS